MSPLAAYTLWRARLMRIASMRAADWRLFAEGLATLFVVHLGLLARPFPRLLAWATTPCAPDGMAAEWPRKRIDHTTWVVGLSARVTFSRCLARSLALSRVLARRGVATDVRIGVQTVEGELKAHAWVEWHGSPINDNARSLEPYAPFDRLPREARHV